MPRRRKPPQPTRAQKVRHLIALDASNIMKRLALHHVEMVSLFSRLRDRAPMVETVKSWFCSVEFSALAELEPSEQAAANAFYQELGELRWYLQYTEDMPMRVQQEVVTRLAQLQTAHRKLTGAIGPPDAEGAPVVDAEVVGPGLP